MGDDVVTKFYSLYSFVTEIRGWPALLPAIHARLEPFAIQTPTASDLIVSFDQADGPCPGRAAARECRRVYDFPGGHVSYDDARRQLTIAVGDRVYATCDPEGGRARVVVDSPRASDVYLLSHPILTVLLMELLKWRGLYPVHAAGLALNGCGVLLAGTSGAGKSTLSVALARRGFSFLSDDTIFLQADTTGWRVRAFPDQVDLCADTVTLFPELAHLARADLPPGWRKRQMRVETVYDAPIAWDAAPRVLVFPAVRGTPTSVLRALSPEEALLELTPNVLLTDAGESQQHLDALAGLVSQCACYRLDTGRDLDEATALVRRAVA